MTADTLTRPLTDSERALAAQYHKLIYRVIEDCHLPNDAAADAYGEAALGLILAAQRYMQDEKLQQYCFSRPLHTAVCVLLCCVSAARLTVSRWCSALTRNCRTAQRCMR